MFNVPERIQKDIEVVKEKYGDVLAKVNELRWIDCKDAAPYKDCLACDRLGQIWLARNFMYIADGRVFDADTVDVEEDGHFYQKIHSLYGEEFLAGSREILSWIPIPLPDEKIDMAKELINCIKQGQWK